MKLLYVVWFLDAQVFSHSQWVVLWSIGPVGTPLLGLGMTSVNVASEV